MAKLRDRIISFFYTVTYKRFIRRNVVCGDAVLDIGSGSGFLKPLVEREGGFYFGIEPRREVYEKAVELHGADGFQNSFLLKNVSEKKYNKLFILTVLDEVADKVKFLDAIKSYGDQNSIFLSRA